MSIFRYYNSEKKNPFKFTDIRSSYWEVEQMYANTEPSNDICRNEYRMEFIYDFPDMLDSIDSNMPLGIKAFLYANYIRRGGSKVCFPGFLSSYIMNSVL